LKQLLESGIWHNGPTLQWPWDIYSDGAAERSEAAVKKGYWLS